MDKRKTSKARALDEAALALCDELARAARKAARQLGAVDAGLAYLRAGLGLIAGAVGPRRAMQLMVEELSDEAPPLQVPRTDGADAARKLAEAIDRVMARAADEGIDEGAIASALAGCMVSWGLRSGHTRETLASWIEAIADAARTAGLTIDPPHTT